MTATGDCAGHPVKAVFTADSGKAPADPPLTRLQVVGEDGHLWLGTQQQGEVRDAWFAKAGAPTSLLVTARSNGPQASWLQAYRCVPDKQRMESITWDGIGGLSVRDVRVDDHGIRVVFLGRSGEEIQTSYRYEDGGLAGTIPAEQRAKLSAVSAVQLAAGQRLTVHTLPNQFAGESGGPLLVQDEAGHTLLERAQGAVRVYGVRTAGASPPLLLLVLSGGGSMGDFYEAYRYDPAQARLVRVPWGDHTYIISRGGVETAGEKLRTANRANGPGGWRQVSYFWQYGDEALHISGKTMDAPPYPRDENTVLLVAFDASFRRLAGEVPRYFRDAGLAHQFYDDLTRQTPDGGYLFYSLSDQPKSGPVLIWWTPDPPVKAPPELFRAQATFGATDHGPQITSLTFSRVDLAVSDARAALQVLQQQPELRGLEIPEPDLQGNHWTTMIPGAGFWRVDPLTGKATRD